MSPKTIAQREAQGVYEVIYDNTNLKNLQDTIGMVRSLWCLKITLMSVLQVMHHIAKDLDDKNAVDVDGNNVLDEDGNQ